MKTYTFFYTEVSMFGSFERRSFVTAKTERSAWKKFFQIQGNRDFRNIQIRAGE